MAPSKEVPLRFVLGSAGLELRFHAPADFAFALIPWTNIPATRFAKMLTTRQSELLHEAVEIKTLTATLRQLLRADLNSPNEFFSEFRALDLHAFTHDFGWRSLVVALTNAAPKFHHYGLIAIERYVEYLQNRESMSRTVASMSSATSPSGAQSRSHDSFSVTSEQPRAVAYGFQQIRLPKNRSVELDISRGDRITISLADYILQIQFDQQWIVSLPNGRAHLLDESPYTVGRDSRCQIVIDSAMSSVSRRHLVVEPLSDTRLRLTDYSSLGSYLEPHSLLRR